jgi:predicted DNA-binding transcriptional regulator YafY
MKPIPYPVRPVRIRIHTNSMYMQRDIFERLTRIDHLIRIKGTGTPAQLAERLNLSERSIYDYISFLKGLGCPIKFDSYRESYYYEEEGSFVIAFTPKSKVTSRESDSD